MEVRVVLADVGDWARFQLESDAHLAAPEHLRVETISVIRGRLLGCKISEPRARDAIDVLQLLEIEHVPMTALTGRIWDLRHNVSAYDAAYVAAAEASLCPLVTLDGRLAKVSGLRCEVRALGA